MKYLLLCILFCLTFTSYSQSTAQYIKAGDQAFADGDYPAAATYYRLILDEDSTILDIAYKYAEASRLCSDYKTAERWYKIVNLKDKGETYHECVFWLGMISKDNGKYKEAKRDFERFVKKYNKINNYFYQKAKNEIVSCDSAIKLSADAQPIIIQHLDQKINTNNSEFAPFPWGDSVLYFSSFRPDSTIGNDLYARIYKSIKDSDDWQLAKQIDTILNSSDYHEGNACFSTDFKRLYFTRCKAVNPSRTRCEIYVRQFKDNKWGQPVRLNDDINLKKYTATQPNIAPDGNGGEIMYFVSNRPGGKGKLDIWSSTISRDGVYGKSINLGDTINTIDDEVSPFYHAATKTLYFSSTGHYGMGGFDIFKTRKDSSGHWKPVKNLGQPFNTRFNDLYFSLNERGDKGYLTSNRTGSFFKKNEHCCDDIFTFTLPVKDSVNPVPKKDIERDIKLLVPISLFFHNDEPDNNTLDTITKKNYKETYDAYLALLTKYKSEYSAGLTGDEKHDAEEDIADFFEDSVVYGFNRLEKFSVLLLQNLQQGKECLVTLKGYCSPLAGTQYNIHLAKRRVSCLVNYFNEYQNGAFKQYMSGDNPLLKFTLEAIGELDVDPTISANPNDQRNSVYSRKASKERKIEIIAIATSKK